MRIRDHVLDIYIVFACISLITIMFFLALFVPGSIKGRIIFGCVLFVPVTIASLIPIFTTIARIKRQYSHPTTQEDAERRTE